MYVKEKRGKWGLPHELREKEETSPRKRQTKTETPRKELQRMYVNASSTWVLGKDRKEEKEEAKRTKKRVKE